MAKSKNPLFSFDAHGTVGDQITFSSWKGATRIRFSKKPQNPQTDFQQKNRSNISFGVLAWQSLSDIIKNLWNIASINTQKPISGYNFFISEYSNSMLSGLNPSIYPPLKYLPGYPVLDGLLSWWRFDEGTGNIAYDFFEKYNATIYGPQWATGRNGYCLSFDGVDDYCYTVYFLNRPNYLSFEAWVKCSVFTKIQTIFSSKEDVSNGTLWIYRPLNSNNLIFEYSNGVSSYTIITCNHFFSGYDNQFIHVVITADYLTGLVKFYRNSVLVSTGTMTTPVKLIKNELFIGDYSTNVHRPFFGLMEQVRIYTKLLSQQEINHNYNL